jgi:hypothetical protein
MHTVRNRLASRPPVAMPFAAGGKVPNHAATRHELALIQRGTMAVPLVGPDDGNLAGERPQKRRNAKGKKARKAAARMAATLEAAGLPPALDEASARQHRAKRAGKKGRAKTAALPQVRAAKVMTTQPQQLPAIPSAGPVLGTYAPPPQKIAPKPAPALALPVRPEPLVEPPLEAPSLPSAIAAGPQSASAPFVLPADAPLPRSQALVPQRRQGLVDVIAFLLRDSGRRLARWSARRHKSREEQVALRRAQAQQINLQRELEALEALRRNRG